MATLDAELEAIERRTQLIQDIKRLAANPEARSLLEKLAQNGTAKALSGTARKKRASSKYAGVKQIAAVRRAITTLNVQKFVVDQVGSELRNSGVDIDNIQIGRVLRRLHLAGELRIVSEGGGSVPNEYEATEKFRTR